MINKSEIISCTSIFIIALLAFYIVENHNAEDIVWGITIKSWTAVFGSLLAASIFLLVQFIIRITGEAKDKIHKEQYNHLCEEQGIKKIYAQRGSNEIVDLYKSLIKKSSRRVWAIGMTNRHFCDQHFDIILPKIKSIKDFECIVSFWNPNINLVSSDSTFHENIISIQEMIENGVSNRADYVSVLNERTDRLTQKINDVNYPKGSIKLIYTSIPTNFTCFVIDNDIFFFPFLSSPESTNTPTIHCDATIGIGLQILNHVDSITKNGKINIIVYDKKRK